MTDERPEAGFYWQETVVDLDAGREILMVRFYHFDGQIKCYLWEDFRGNWTGLRVLKLAKAT